MQTRIDVIQQEVKLWAEANFGPSTLGYESRTNPLLGITEEVGELCHHHLKQAQGIRKNEDHVAGIKDSIGDIFIYLCDYCNRNNLSLAECVAITWLNVSKRNWNKNKINGYIPENMEKEQ